MIETTLQVIGALLKADGVSEATIKTVRDVIENDGMVSTTQARKALHVSAQQVRRLCERHGVRRVTRIGRTGAVVDLNALLKVAV